MSYTHRNQFNPWNDEDVVQYMWDSVRDNYETDMAALRFKQMNYHLSLKWAVALKNFIDENCEVEDDERMRMPNGTIKICRVLVIQLNRTRVLDMGRFGMVHRQQHTRHICVFSRNSYNTLCSYIIAMRAGALRAGAMNALAMTYVIGMMGALSTNDD